MKHYTCVDSVGNISTAPKDRQKSNRYGTQDCLNRLFSYEATGFEPEQVTELHDHAVDLENRCIAIDKEYRAKCEEVAQYEKLEEQGRLIELPCEIGTTIYWIDLSVEPNDKGKWITRMRIKAKKFDYGVLDWIDTPIYLTREAAEKALAERQEVE